jgi:Ca2+/Na+ antiporter
MARATVHHNRLSRYSSLLMIALGLVTYFLVSRELGVALAAIGFLMYAVYLRLNAPRKSEAGAT